MLLGFVTGAEARRPARAHPAQRRAEVLASFARYFGPAAAAPDDCAQIPRGNSLPPVQPVR